MVTSPTPYNHCFLDLFCLSCTCLSFPCDFFLYCTMILQRPRIFVGDAGFEPRTSASEVWCATNEQGWEFALAFKIAAHVSDSLSPLFKKE